MRHARAILTVSALTALVVALVAGVVAVGHGASAAESPRFAAVAKQTFDLPAGSMMWQVTEWDSFPDAEGGVPFAPGFLYAPDATLSVFREGSDRPSPLRADHAMPVRDAIPLAPVATDGAEATVFLAIEVVPEAEAITPAGKLFDLKTAGYTLELLRATLPTSERGDASGTAPLTLEAGAFPTVLVVVAGEIDYTAGAADSEVLAAGASVATSDDISVRRSSEGEAVVVAVTLRATTGASTATNAVGRPGGGGSNSGAGPTATTPGGPRPSPTPTASRTPSPSPSPSPTSPTQPTPSPTPPASGGGLGDAVVQANDPLPCVSCLPTTLDPNAPPSRLVDSDPDDDGLDNDAEDTYGSGRNVWDTDADALGDGAEVYNFGTNPLKPDTDYDALTDWDEIYTTYTDPLNADSDGDGLLDGVEYNDYRTDPSVRDTDGDCLNDGFEVQSLGTHPSLQDTDGDGVLDSSEYGNSDPLNANDAYQGRGWQCVE